jgi:pyruvate-formate lyase-activating enzyme
MSPNDLAPAIQAHQQGRLQEAEVLYRRYLTSHPAEPVAGYNLAIVLLAQGRLEGLSWAGPALAANQGQFDGAAAAASIVQALVSHSYIDAADRFIQWLEQSGLRAAEHAHWKEQTCLPTHLAPLSPPPPAAGAGGEARHLQRYHPIESGRYVYAIDIVGGCNLRCPTCPVGQGANLPKGLMRRDLFQAILRKATQEQAPHTPDIWLFNWGEPLLHPQVADFVRDVREAGLTSLLSSNLNHGERIDAVMQANPDRFKVSLSSLRQEAYAQTHTRGDIERVVHHLHLLARARDRHQASTQIWIGHHLYRHTLEDQPAVQALAQSLGFGYVPSTAIVAPIETALRLATVGPGQPDDPPLLGELLAPPWQTAPALQARRSGRFDCELRFNMTSIQYDGNVTLCCGTTQPLGGAPVAFLSQRHEALEAMKYEHPFCGTCMKHNLHLTTADR